MDLSRDELLSGVQVAEEEDAVKAILDKEEGLLNIYYLVFEGNVEVSKNRLSWIQTLYMERTLSLYGETDLFQKYVNTTNTDKYSLKKWTDLGPDDDDSIASLLDRIDVTNSKATCEDKMKAYADTVYSVTGKEIHNMQLAKPYVLTCTPWSDITWAHFGSPAIFWGGINYPNENSTQVTQNKTKWETYFGDGSTSVASWLKIPAKYHFIWRNKLIPAHEIIHATLHGAGGDESEDESEDDSGPIEDSPQYRLCNLDKSRGTCLRCKRHQKAKGWMKRNRRAQGVRAYKNCIKPLQGVVFLEEWASSAANGIIFLKYKKNQYDKTSSNREKKKIQLEAIGAMCYMWVLIKTMRAVVPQTRTGGELERRVATLDRWVKLENGMLEKSDTWHSRGVWSELEFIYKSVTEGGLGNAGYSWANTYAKHIVALAYSLNFLGGDKEDKAEQMLTEILDGTIWERDDSDNGWRVDNYTSIALDLSVWESPTQPPLAEWLTEAQPVQAKLVGGSNISPYSFIINPATGLKVSINERLGKSILINYLNMLN